MPVAAHVLLRGLDKLRKHPPVRAIEREVVHARGGLRERVHHMGVPAAWISCDYPRAQAQCVLVPRDTGKWEVRRIRMPAGVPRRGHARLGLCVDTSDERRDKECDEGETAHASSRGGEPGKSYTSRALLYHLHLRNRPPAEGPHTTA
jgi:hypothetical protein